MRRTMIFLAGAATIATLGLGACSASDEEVAVTAEAVVSSTTTAVEVVNGSESTTEVVESTTTTSEPEAIEPTPAPTVDRPAPGPPATPSDLDFETWLAEFIEFAADRHEGDFLNFLTLEHGASEALAADAFDRRDAYSFTTQCDLLPYTSAHLADAPGLPESPLIAEAYQELLDSESQRWGFQQAKCDAVDHDDVRAGLAGFPADAQSDSENDFISGGHLCDAVVRAITDETGVELEVSCLPPGEFEIDRELPEGFAEYVEGW